MTWDNGPWPVGDEEPDYDAIEKYYDPIFDEQARVRDFSKKIEEILPSQVRRIQQTDGMVDNTIIHEVCVKPAYRKGWRRFGAEYVETKMWRLNLRTMYVTEHAMIVRRNDRGVLEPLDLSGCTSFLLADLHYQLCILGTRVHERKKIVRLDQQPARTR